MLVGICLGSCLYKEGKLVSCLFNIKLHPKGQDKWIVISQREGKLAFPLIFPPRNRISAVLLGGHTYTAIF